MNKISLILIFFILGLILTSSTSKDEIELDTKIDKVKVFLQGAQIYRSGDIYLNKGVQEIRIKNLSPFINESSIQAKASHGALVLAIKFERNYLNKISKNRKIDSLRQFSLKVLDSIEIYKVKSHIILEDLNFIKLNYQINQKGIAAEIKDMADFYAKRIEKLKFSEIEINRKFKNWNQELSNISNQIKVIGGESDLPTGEIVIEIEAKQSIKHSINVSYNSAQASWLPSYDIIATSTAQPLDMTFKALVTQNTMEDWSNVNLILSSESPEKDKTPKSLLPYYLNYNLAPPSYRNINTMIAGVVKDEQGEPMVGASITVEGTSIGTITDLDGRFSFPSSLINRNLKVDFIGYETKQINATNNMNIILEESGSLLEEVVVMGYAASNQDSDGYDNKKLEEKKKKAQDSPKQEVASYGQINEQIIGFEYAMDSPFSLRSGEKYKSIDIKSYKVPVTYTFSASPKINNDVYITASTDKWDNDGLIDGQANIYYESTFIGKSIMSFTNDIDSLTISLGIDENLKVTRQKDKESLKKSILSSKIQETKSWVITAKNFKSSSISLDIYDQIPVSTNEEIEVEYKNESNALYNKAIGSLKWTLSLMPKSEQKIKLNYKVKYPNSRSLLVE
jgi:hypothetical protein